MRTLDENNRRVLKNFPELQKLYENEYRETLLTKAKNVFDKFMNNMPPPINYDYCDDVKSVFEKYFDKRKPFGEGKKKDEFPDAFTLQMLERYCQQNGLSRIIVLSNDKDMQEYESRWLNFVDYKKYVTEKQVKADTLQKIACSIEREKDTLSEKIQEQIIRKLEDTWLYINCFDTDEISDIEIRECRVDIKDDFSIVSEDKTRYIVELEAISICEVGVTYFDLSEALYDREDNRYYGGEWKTMVLDGKEDFAIQIRIDNRNYQISDINAFEVEDAIPNFRNHWDFL